MLRKRSRSIQKDQQQMAQTASSDGGSVIAGQRQKTNSFFNVPGLFVGLGPQVVSDCDSVRSPTSPLDFKLFSGLGSSFRFPKFTQDGHQKSWDGSKLGLGSIVDSLDDDNNVVKLHEKSMPSSSSKTILFGSQVRSKAPNSPTSYYNALFCEAAPNSLPRNHWVFPGSKVGPSNLRKGSSDVFFEIGDDPLEFDPIGKLQSFSLDSRRPGMEMLRLRALNAGTRIRQSCFGYENSQGGVAIPRVGNNLTSGPISVASGSAFAPALTPSEIELSEDYTCVISHGPNPKTTHIFGDCVLGSHPIGTVCANKRESLDVKMSSLEMSPRSPCRSDDFLSFCCYCNKKLEGKMDIYMYRGEKAFCSSECREEGIVIEEEKEKSINKAAKEPSESENGDENFEKSIFIVI